MVEYKNQELLTNAVNNSNSIADVCRYFNLIPKGKNYDSIKTAINFFNIDTSHFKQNTKFIKPRDLSEILINGLPCNGTSLKKRLFKEGVKEYKCEKCGISEWNGEPIILELHHINGNHNDNHLENLQILCPNCHSQTPTFTGKNINNVEYDIQKLIDNENKRKKEIYENKQYWGEIRKTKPKQTKICLVCGKIFKGKGEKYCSIKCAGIASQKTNISKDDILNASKIAPSLIQLGKLFNMSDNGIRKWLIKYGILDEVKKNMKKN